MVDVSDKNTTKRSATAHSSITVNPAIYKQIVDHTNQKGMCLILLKLLVLWLQNTSDIIPMCHPLPLTGIDITFDWQENTSIHFKYTGNGLYNWKNWCGDGSAHCRFSCSTYCL